MRFRPHYTMPLWLIPMLYTVASVTAGLILPRLEHAYFAGYTENISVGSLMPLLPVRSAFCKGRAGGRRRCRAKIGMRHAGCAGG